MIGVLPSKEKTLAELLHCIHFQVSMRFYSIISQQTPDNSLELLHIVSVCCSFFFLSFFWSGLPVYLHPLKPWSWPCKPLTCIH